MSRWNDRNSKGSLGGQFCVLKIITTHTVFRLQLMFVIISFKLASTIITTLLVQFQRTKFLESAWGRDSLCIARYEYIIEMLFLMLKLKIIFIFLKIVFKLKITSISVIQKEKRQGGILHIAKQMWIFLSHSGSYLLLLYFLMSSSYIVLFPVSLLA